MVSIVAFFVAAGKNDFEGALHEYMNGREKDEEHNEDVDDIKSWMDGIVLQEIHRKFIPQCETRGQASKTITKSVFGVVTGVSEDGGLIDDHIYFALNRVNAFDSDDAINVGHKVQVDAEKCVPYGGWRATTVTRIRASHDDAHVTVHGSAVSCVTRIENGFYYLEHGHKFGRENLSTGYLPIIGDWVKIKVTKGGQIEKTWPLRTKEITGKVTQTPRYDKEGLEVTKGVINNEIQFSLDVCENNYMPWRDDEVQAMVIESRQIWCVWRAVSVKLITKRKNQNEKEPQKFKSSNWVLRGGYPEMPAKRASIPSFLPRYPIPKNIKDNVENGEDVLPLLPSLKSTLTLDNYAERFSALIYLEEIYADIEIRKHGIKGACLEKRGSYLCLNVPGIADGRPNLSIGDIVVLHEPLATSPSVEYHGFIHHVINDKEEILLKFHATFQENFESSGRYNVEFKYSRAPFRRCHFAVRLAQRRSCSELLFPERIKRNMRKQCNIQFVEPGSHVEQSDSRVKPTATETKQIVLFNDALNLRQRQAVERMLAGEAIHHPYILFGPPGTGKTVTLVEVILHLYSLLKWTRILVCAPSNSAVDVICERLAQTGLVDEGDMVRFNATRRLEGSIPSAIAKFCHSEEAVERTSRYRIILATCVNSGIFYALQLPKDHFTHVVIDEAGQATEPEIQIPIGLQTRGQIIMAGDPEQLGPVIKSPMANMYGLNNSLLERLMELPLYSRSQTYKDGYNPLIVTKLTQNYRSHPHLLELPSKLFYMGELEACARGFKYSSLLEWDHLPKPGFPIIFHGLVGQHLRESDSPSLMNPGEVVQTIRYIKLLTRDQNVANDDIGILTPYRKQVEKIRMMLQAVGIEGIKVGSVEEFQGQEKSVIVISTVRSNPASDLQSKQSGSIRGALGFLSNYKRFNVATTRAKILMIVLGNPNVLSLDPHWRALLTYCVDHGGYTGCDKTSLELKDPL